MIFDVPRRAYGRAQLTEAQLPSHWPELFGEWFADAVAHQGIVEANAMQLATVSADGVPSVRTVLAKGVDTDGVVFYTNYESAKGRDLAAVPYAAAVFAWLVDERQVRISGPVSPVAREQTEAYFATRPRGAQIAAWASPQSEIVDGRAALDTRLAAVTARFGDGPIAAPPHWGGYRINPESVEFWQGGADRLHDRIRYRRLGPDWVIERLAP